MFKRFALPLGLILGFTTACVTHAATTEANSDESSVISSEEVTIDTLGMNASDEEYLILITEE